MKNLNNSVDYTQKCKICGQQKLDHKAKTYHCPRSRLGLIKFAATKVFQAKDEDKKVPNSIHTAAKRNHK